MWIHYQTVPRDGYGNGYLVSYNTSLHMVDGPMGSYLDTNDKSDARTTDSDIKHYLEAKGRGLSQYANGDLLVDTSTSSAEYSLLDGTWGGSNANYTGLDPPSIVSISPAAASGSLFYVFANDGTVSEIDTATKSVVSTGSYGG